MASEAPTRSYRWKSLFTLHRAAVGVSIAISFGSMVYACEQAKLAKEAVQDARRSADAAQQQASEAKRSSDLAERALNLQTPSVRIRLDINRSRIVSIHRKDGLYEVSFWINMEASNAGTAPAGVESARFSWSGNDMSMIAGYVHRPAGSSEHKEIHTAVGETHSAIIIPELSEKQFDPELPLTLDVGSVKVVYARLFFTFALDRINVDHICSRASNASRDEKTQVKCIGAGPWEFKDIDAFNQVIAEANSGKDIFGWPAFANEIGSKDGPVELITFLTLATGSQCTIRTSWHLSKSSQGVCR